MKPLGPYVAARDLPGRMNSPVRTLRATDRLTGMPVLLHGLPAPQPVPDLPEHPNVLGPAECVEIAGEAFMVTELPLQARPAQDPERTARGALEALTALHERGVVHGGLSASQLWSVDGEVLLAGAGLPWGGEARPADDLYALAVILHEMGGVPRALQPLLDAPGRLSARDALAQLRTPTPPEVTVPPADAGVTPGAAPVAAVQVPPDSTGEPVAGPAVSTSSGPPEPPSPQETEAAAPDPAQPLGAAHTDTRGRRGRGSRFRLPGRTAAQNSAGPGVPSERPGDAVPGLPAPVHAAPPAQDMTPEPARSGPEPGAERPAPEANEAAPDAVPTPVTSGPEVIAPPREQGAEPPQGPLNASDVPAPRVAGGRLSPQERRRREHEARQEQAALDAQAAAGRRQRTAAVTHTPPPPLQIGFDDLPAWEADGPESAPRPALNLREVERLPASLRRAPLPAEVTEPEPVGTIPARRGAEPIRIGWDEDDSWRVVREAPAAPVRPRRPLLWRVLFWSGLAAVIAVGVLLAIRVGRPAADQASARSTPVRTASPAAAPVAQPQTVLFTVRGVAGARARLSVEQSPKAANLAPGASLGVAPGRVTFPAAGTYRVRVAVDGYAPGSMTVTVPRAQPVTIDLDR